MAAEKGKAAAYIVASNRELASVPTPMLARKLHAFFADTACAVFREYEEPNTPPVEQAVKQRLTAPLQWMLCAGDPTLTFAGLDQQKSQSNFCGKVFKSGEPAYFCKDCQTDPTCCLCMDCFEHSEHKNHRYRLFASGGGGCCDCGDPEAWTTEVHCQKHKPTQQKDDELDPVESLRSDLVDRARIFFSTILWYCMDVLSWEEGQSVPPYLHIGRTSESLAEDKVLAFLYNDEIHSYDEVIQTLTQNVKLQHSDAVALATYVDRKGRAVTKVGTEEDCLRCNEQVNTSLRTKLTVHAYHTALVAHQHNSIYCLNLLKELAEKSPAFCRLISQALLKVNQQKENPCCVLDKVFLIDSKLWIAARITWHRLILGSVYMDAVYKKDLAISLASNYCQLQKNFVADSHHHDVCASNMTVQLFTVPSLSRMLVLEHGLLRIIVSTLLDILTPCKDPITNLLKLRSSNYKHSRVFYIMYDLRYVLRNKPEVWTEKLRAQVLDAFDYLLDLLGLIQNSDPVKRQRGIHVEREEPWEHSFNFSIVLQPAILMFIEWCCLDRKVLQRAVTATMKKHTEVSQRDKLIYKQHTCEVSLVGRRSMELIVFDILKDYVSIHQPLPRVIASLLAGADAHGMTIPQLLQYEATDCQGRLFLMEHCSRSIVMAGQVMAGMWKRNGYSVVNQIINYQFHYSKEVMYDRDILMLQCMASILDPNTFLYALVYKFRLEKWLSGPLSAVGKRGEQKDDQLKFLINELEEFLFLLIIIFCERYITGVGRGVSNTDSLKREIIHRLYIAPQTHSELVKQFRLKENENEIDKLLKEVAVLRRTGVGGKSVFELKPEYEKECSPFFYHYTRIDHSKAAEARRKRTKELGGVRRLSPSPPERPPPFTVPFEGIKRLTSSPVLHRVIQCVLKQSSITSETRVWSDKLLHEVLFLCGIMFLEEEPTEPTSLCNAAIGQFGDNAFFTEFESLLNSDHAKEHFPLISWIVQYLRTAREHGPGTPTKINQSGSHQTDGGATAANGGPRESIQHSVINSGFNQISEKKKKMAMEQRKKLMDQISNMQKKFLDAHQEELEEVDMGASEEGVSDEVVARAPPPRCAVGVVSLLDHPPPPRSLTCILCQEESKDTSSQEKPFVQAVFVQRSAVLRRGDCDQKELDFLSARADLPSGTYSGGCGHHMHAECWKSFLENKRQEHSRSFFFPIPGQSVQWQSGEFLCPLCQCYGNAVLPVMLHIRHCSLPGSLAKTVDVFRPTREIKMDEWKEMIDLALDMASAEEPMETGSSVDPILLDKLEEVLPGYRKPSCLYGVSQSEAEAQLTTVQSLFSQAIYMRAYKTNPDETSDKVSLALWDNCAYTITSIERNARYQDNFLLQPGALSPRQLDNIRSLVRLGCEPKVRPSLPGLVKYAQQLSNSFLHTNPPFSELPCILEVDTFHMMVNLHFTLSSLFAAVTSPHGPSGPSGGNPVLPALIGITDEHIVRITAAAHVLQYLITCPPCPSPMEVDAPSKSGSGTEFGNGVGLQELWLKYRRLARLPVESPPSPYDLVAGVQEHLYAFLESSALFFYCLSGIDFVYSSAASGLATRFEDLCQYIGMPSAVHMLFAEDPSIPTSLSITRLANHWCSHPRLPEIVKSDVTPLVLQIPRQLVKLPERYSDLVKKASTFQCPQRLGEGDFTDDGQAAMLCLVCGEMLCTNSYCCQKVVEVEGEEVSDEDKLRIGGFTQHAQSCGSGLGMAIWILESYVVLLDVTDVQNVKGCTVTPPYLDEYGETDPGLRRGNPLKLNLQTYNELRLLWFHHKIPERISTEMEGNRGLLRINWSKM